MSHFASNAAPSMSHNLNQHVLSSGTGSCFVRPARFEAWLHMGRGHDRQNLEYGDVNGRDLIE